MTVCSGLNWNLAQMSHIFRAKDVSEIQHTCERVSSVPDIKNVESSFLNLLGHEVFIVLFSHLLFRLTCDF